MSDRQIVSKEIGKLLVQGCLLLKTSCGTCEYALIQDKQGKEICANCNLTGHDSHVSGEQNSPDASAQNQKSNEKAAVLDRHNEEVGKILRKVELNLLAEYQNVRVKT